VTVRRPNPSYDAAARRPDGTLNLDLEQALHTHSDRIAVAERALGIGGLDPSKQTKIAPIPPLANVALLTGAPGSGQATVSITNPEFIRGRGNPLRTPIYHHIRYGVDPTFRNAVTDLPPSLQTHWPILVQPGIKTYVEVSHSYDGTNWTQPIVKGPVKA
jgi:hypothetical protein